MLKTIVKERLNGADLGLFAFVAAIFAVHYGLHPATSLLNGLGAENALALAACLYAIVRNFIDFSQRYRTLVPLT